MPELPTGTVTFLFTDIEGSTRLLEELGDRYADVLSEHRRVLRQAFDRHGGVEVDTQGDAFFVAFSSAAGAVAAAEEAQAALAIPVRMGIHTGEPQITDDGYVGLDVHRAARIAAAAHGGQVVLSARSLVDGLPLKDLGLHRLKDLREAERLYQLGEREFPPIRSLNATNLPVQPNQLVGREREVVDVTELVRDGARLVTLTGSGGTGKTRLALQAAAELVEEFVDGVFWVPLAALRDPDLVLPTVEQALGAKVSLAEHVDQKRMLLLLDNLEQVLECAPALSELLARCPSLHLLVTSRALLRIAGEQEYAVEPLPEDDAVALFVERAWALEPPAAVHAICRRLEGLPLAVELAAARTRLLAPDKLLERLDRALPVLTGGRRDAPERQRTLRATIEWSYQLLDDEEQRLFARLSVFAGSFTVEAAEQICEAELDTLESLLEKSLLRRWESGRLGMLETIREFAAELLEGSGETDVIRRRHADWLLQALDPDGRMEAVTAADIRMIGIEQDNIRSALTWALAAAEPVTAARLAVAAHPLWVVRDPHEGMRWFERVLERPDDLPGRLRGTSLRAYGGLANPGGDDALAERLYEQALSAFREAGDEKETGALLMQLGYQALYRGDAPRARELGEESLVLCRETGFLPGESQAISLVGEADCAEGELERGIAQMERGAELAGEAGFTWWRAGMLGKIADRLREQGRSDEAEPNAREALSLSLALGDRLRMVRGLARLARLAAERGDRERAGRLWGVVEAEEAHGPIGAWENEREGFANIVLSAAGPDFEAGLEHGRTLSLEQGVEHALADA